MIEVVNLEKDYRLEGETIKAVDNINFKVDQGEFMAILGHSGSGKTTLLNLLGGLTRPTHGTVKIEGQDIWDLSDNQLSEMRNEKMNFIFQFASLIPTLNVIDNILLPTAFGKKRERKHYDHAMELLGIVGLTEKGQAYPAQLSGGQQRRVAIARAFINAPKIILADEPTGDLDEKTEQEMVNLFRKMNQEENTTFIIVTHSSSLAAQTDRQMRMTSGRLEAEPNGCPQ